VPRIVATPVQTSCNRTAGPRQTMKTPTPLPPRYGHAAFVASYVAVIPDALLTDAAPSTSAVRESTSPAEGSVSPAQLVDTGPSPVAPTVQSPSPGAESKLDENVSPSKANKGLPTKITLPVVTWSLGALPDHAEADCVIVLGGHDGSKRDSAAYCLKLNPFAAWTTEEPVVRDLKVPLCHCLLCLHGMPVSRWVTLVGLMYTQPVEIITKVE
jgi:hypothetical protein